MSETSISIIPRIKDYPDRKARAEEIIEWLADLDIIKPELSDCLAENGRGYAVSDGVKNFVLSTGNIGLPNCALEVITEHTMFCGYMNQGASSFGFSQSNLGFTFWNWPEFKPEFLQRFSKKLNHEVDVIMFRP
ncbi:MAG: hypothetical protein KA149_07550 [Chitinophagales bacterium]|nr:hypothetical protein [Chitinophagales bacterium]